jgi:hypothetical protein
MRLWSVGLCCALALMPRALGAQEGMTGYLRSQVGTLYTTASPQFAEGKLYGCIIEFANIAQDWAYKQGRFIRVGGSLGIMATSGKYGVTLKVILYDVDANDLRMTPSVPSSAFFYLQNLD